MGLRRPSLAVIKHRDCQPAERAEPRSWTALETGRAGVGDLASRKLCHVMGLGNAVSEHGVSEHELQFGSEDHVPALGDKIGVSVEGAKLEGFGESQLLHCLPFDIGQLNRYL